jgi:hypothetical protein
VSLGVFFEAVDIIYKTTVKGVFWGTVQMIAAWLHLPVIIDKLQVAAKIFL